MVSPKRQRQAIDEFIRLNRGKSAQILFNRSLVKKNASQ